MAMSADAATQLIMGNLGGLKGSAEQTAEAEKMINAIAKGIIDEIIANGIVTTPVTTGSSAGSYDGTIS